MKCFDKFVFSPSVGASGGLLILWNRAAFQGSLVHRFSFALAIEFKSVLNSYCWMLTNIYGPCDGEPRDEFVDWLYNLTMPTDLSGFFLMTLTSSYQFKIEISRGVIRMTL